MGTRVPAAVVRSWDRLVYGAVHGGTTAAMSFPVEGKALLIYGLILLFAFGYTAYSGFRAVISTDAVQFVFIAAMIIGVIAYLGPRMPDLMTRHAAVFGNDFLASVINPVARDTAAFLFFFVFMNLLFWVAWWPVAMDQWHRCAATTSIAQATNKSLGTSGFLTRGFLLLLVAAFVLIGAATRAYVAPGGELPDPIPTFFRSLMPGGALAAESPVLSVTMAGIVLMGLLAAVLSTVDTYIVVLTQSLMIDVFGARRDNATLVEADARTSELGGKLRLARSIAFGWLIVVCLLGWAISSTTLDAFNIVYAGFAFQMAFIPVLLIALAGRAKGKGVAATAALAVGGIWCCVSFPYLFIRLTAVVQGGNVAEMYHLLDLMFADTVLVALVSTTAFYIARKMSGTASRAA
jgi:Na+/proline symporter